MLEIQELGSEFKINCVADEYARNHLSISGLDTYYREDSPSEIDFMAKFGKKFLYFLPNFEIDEINEKIKNIGFSTTSEGTVFFIKNAKELNQIRNHYYSYDNHDRLIIVPQNNSNNFSMSLNIYSIINESNIYFEEYFDGDGYSIYTNKYSIEDLENIAKKLDSKAKAPLKKHSAPLYAYLLAPITLLTGLIFLLLSPFIIAYFSITKYIKRLNI